ncbi:MAG: SLC13 family permease [Alphaproteobacteria bacterium]
MTGGREADGRVRQPPAVRWTGLMLGALLFAGMMAIPPRAGMSADAWRVAGLAVLMAVWWLTEALPVAVTALAPVAGLPILKVATLQDAASPYAHPLIFLFMGGFMIALAIERWGLHRRVALAILRLFGTRPSSLVAGFMVASAGLSMWVSNTATAVMMLPIGLSVIALLHEDGVAVLPEREDHAFSLALLLAIAYGASIGGLGTLIGTPPNALLAAFMSKTYGFEIGFGRWMLVGVPLATVMLGIAWVVLTRIAFRVRRTPIAGAEAAIEAELGKLGPMGAEEKRVAAVFTIVALAWVFRPLITKVIPDLSDPGIALLGALALFAIPAGAGRQGALMNWDWAKRLPWGVLILFGGGLSLASAIQASGLAVWIGKGLETSQTWPLVAIVALVVALMVFVTELTSNTATTAVFLPVLAAFAASIALNPLMLAVPAALAASCAYMLPVATPPNAIIFSSERITVPDMARAGFLLNLVAIGLIVAASYSLVIWVFGVDLKVLPDWAARSVS